MRITIMFTRDNHSLLSDVVCWRTLGEYSHVGVKTDNGHRFLSAVPFKGVREDWLYPIVVGTLDGRMTCKSFNVEVPDEVGEKVVAFLKAQIGKPYDMKGALGIGFNRNWRHDGRWWCSELVAAAFEYAGFPLIRTDHKHSVTPQDLLLSPYLV